VDTLPTRLAYDAVIPRELTTERLLLRQWRDDDVGALYEIYTQPEYLETMPALTLDATRVQVEGFKRRWADDGYCQWAAYDLESGVLVGRIGLLCHHDWPLADGSIPEVGWVLHRDWWGRGLATEGGQAGVDAWLEHLPEQPRLYSFTLPRNRRSRAVMERLGFTHYGEAHWHGYDTVWYALDR
jgi:ribosomal-protein-alanine N-acetyltransferase